MIIKIFTGPNNYDISSLYNKDEEEYIIGVDIGAYLLAKNNMRIDLSIGDFDSVSTTELSLIEKFSNEVQKFDEKKEYTIQHDKDINNNVYGSDGRGRQLVYDKNAHAAGEFSGFFDNLISIWFNGFVKRQRLQELRQGAGCGKLLFHPRFGHRPNLYGLGRDNSH